MILISYLITCKNSENQLSELLSLIEKYLCQDDECIILDDNSDNPVTISILENYVHKDRFKIYQHDLNNNYSEHKNYGKTFCKKDWVFQIDDDELPSESLLGNIKEIIELNNVELIWVPRINLFSGIKESHAKQWGWKLSDYNGKSIVNFPDYQGRIFKNINYIKWERPLHEKIEGSKTYAFLPSDYELSIFHLKTVDKQIQTNLKYNKELVKNSMLDSNLKYNKEFSKELNAGFKI